MKKIFLTIMVVSLAGLCAQAQRISTTLCSVTVYTDNGVYVKAYSANSHKVNVKLTYTEQVVKDGDTIDYENTYSFSIAAKEEKQLFVSSNKVTALTITSCQEEDNGVEPTQIKATDINSTQTSGSNSRIRSRNR